MERRSRAVGCSTAVSSFSPFWQHLWKLKIPRLVTLFLWRACNEVLPTKSNLYKRKVVSVPDCPMCGIEVEMAGHACGGVLLLKLFGAIVRGLLIKVWY